MGTHSRMKKAGRSKIKAVIFDFDGVFVNRFAARSAADFCNTFHVNKNEFNAFAGKAALGLDTGKERELDFFSAIVKKFNLPLSASGMKKLFTARDKKNLKKDSLMYQWLRASRHGVRTALLSNVSRELSGRLRAQGLYIGFGKRFFSYRIGAAKPSAEAYR